MRVPRKEPEKARIEVVPMIDIIFFLLVFFMISTLSMTMNRGLPVNRPKAASSQRDLRESFNITVTRARATFSSIRNRLPCKRSVSACRPGW